MSTTTNYLGATDISGQMLLLNNKIDALKNKLTIMNDVYTILSLYEGNVNKVGDVLTDMAYDNVILSSNNTILFDKFGWYCTINFSKQVPVLSVTRIGDII